MKILALELSTSRGSVAMIDGEAELFSLEFPNDRKHSGKFFETLEAANHSCGLPDRIVVGVGPGSYAGIRIAISAAVGLGAASGAELIGIASPCAVAVPHEEFYFIGDARRHSFSFAHLRNGDCEEGPVLMSETEMRQRLEGTAMPLFSSQAIDLFPDAALAFPSALRLAQLARTAANVMTPPLQPLYLREPQITQSKQPTWAGAQ